MKIQHIFDASAMDCGVWLASYSNICKSQGQILWYPLNGVLIGRRRQWGRDSEETMAVSHPHNLWLIIRLIGSRITVVCIFL